MLFSRARTRLLVPLLGFVLLATSGAAVATSAEASLTAGDPSVGTLLVSERPDRASARPLDGASIGAANIYVFFEPAAAVAARVRFVDFSLDGQRQGREMQAPYDLVGGGVGTADPLSVALLGGGSHEVAVRVRIDRGWLDTAARFDVGAARTTTPTDSPTTTAAPTTTTAAPAPTTTTTTAPAQTTTTTAAPTTTSTTAAPATTTTTAPAPTTSPATTSAGKLTWAPPSLSNPTTIRLSTSQGTVRLDSTRDYVLEMPSSPVTRSLKIAGGRNIVMIGGEIDIPWQGDNPSASSRRALLFQDQTGTVHVEGLHIYGDDLSEGIQIAAPQAVVQLQNIRIENVHARDQVNFTDNHPDVVQTWGGVKTLRIDRLTGESDYQGLYLAKAQGPIGSVHVKRANIRSLPTARFLLWTTDDYPLTVEDVYAEPGPSRSWGQTVWGKGWGNAAPGVPSGGDFVTASAVGIGYRAPGYNG